MKKKEKDGSSLTSRIWHARYIYLLILPVMIWIAVFCYGPMYGVVLAFKDYNARLGILGSEWVGLKHFKRIFITPEAIRSIKNTFIISGGRLIIEFPIPIILAILFAEMPGTKVKKLYQTILTFPHFLSWIVVSAVMLNFFANKGAVNVLLSNMGMKTVDFFGSTLLARPMLYLSSIWKEVGWGSIIFVAAIAGIDPTLYEAAKIDGASKLRQIWHITLTGIRATILVMLILKVGHVMNAGFDQVFNLRNGVTTNAIQILDTYIYDITFLATPNYGFSTAVGLFKNVINLTLMLVANKVTHIISGEKMIG